MDIRFDAPTPAVEALILPVFAERTMGPGAQAVDQQSGGMVTRALGSSRFEGKPGEILDLMAPESTGAARLVLVGMGARDAVTPDELEKGVAAATKSLLLSGLSSAALRLDGLNLPAELAARAGVAVRMAGYRFDAYRPTLPEKKRPSLTAVSIVSDDPGGVQAAYEPQSHIMAGVELARDLVNEPANILHPEEFARRIQDLESVGLHVEILGETEMARLGMNSLLGVGQGSVRDSQLAIMKWNGGGDEAPMAFVGKGVCFDTGGISLKPGPGMGDMRGDMGGAAAVTGAMRGLAGRRAPVNAVGVVALVENMPDGNAQRPGDIVTSMSGQTIEILNTDAEGRLILCDAMTYTEDRFKPAFMVDLATLTGAILVALAQEHAGLFSDSDALSDAITTAAAGVGEPVWRLPMGPAYDKMIDSPNADMQNIANSRDAGSIVAAQFLKRFVKQTPWAHLDIAGTGWRTKRDDARYPTFGTGYGVRLLNALADAPPKF